jgi:ankyrin repeat protein
MDMPSILWIACETNDLAMLQEALKANTVDQRSPNQSYTPLMVAANRNHLQLVDYLIRAGADVNARSESGETALMLAARSSNSLGVYQTVTLLISAGANPNLVSDGGNSPLMEAAYSGHANALGLLIESGANINHTNKYLETALLVGSLSHGTVAAVKTLIDAGANLRHRDCDGATAIDLAQKNNTAIYEYYKTLV